MSHFTYSEFLEASHGKPLTAPVPFASPSARLWTDTRSIQLGDFFLPLSGERFDGHDYLPQAFEQGAIGAFVSEAQTGQHPEWHAFPNLIAVPDPTLAYLAMARHHRNKINPLVIAVTGSSGKTTTKEMLYAALSPLKKTVKTEKNFNNEVGVSQTLLALQPGTEILIVEMGMRGLGQIAILSEAALPDAAMVVNVGPAHIGLLGSLENIAQAKLEIASGLNPKTGLLVINGDDPQLTAMAPRRWSGRLEQYHLQAADGIHPVSDSRGDGIAFSYQGHRVTLAVPGEHMVSNALGVLRLGEALGFSVAALAEGLSAFVPEKGRWERTPLDGFSNVWVINDAYNANPDSAKASLKAFLETASPEMSQILVLGGMKELGSLSESYHRELGVWLSSQTSVAALFTIGAEAECLADTVRQQASYPVFFAEDVQQATQQVLQAFASLENAVLYLKGSRAYHLDELPQLLQDSSSVQALL